ncbi:MAG: ABC transporter ATP-binding protein [Rheinheimera sp.]|uniref:ABC transporter ATP-binding protein n=1 Tax=Arsukibacterium sp. UBA3155 TaxID=1946058 RepID=UPI000C95CB2F|nr:ABC transporter ATP-binding protein [Arsukibacterium sp. UBA3155]MAD75107.1 ABC transporter ATP-binding protein [Rheinheimera sp.]|tara:strand:+ start:72196 stop:72849 length:654 start_codon:yes stop_codon:yes gene_type:complete
MLQVTRLAKSHQTPQGPLPLFSDLSFDIKAGESVALMGESGCGKSTLLHILAGLEQADKGQVLINNQDIMQLNDSDRALLRRNYVGVIFQQLNLIPSLTIADNLAFQARLAGTLDTEWLHNLVSTLGLETLLTRYPAQLSGGQQQRVAIGRALAARTPLLFADEPTGSLDEANAEQVMTLMLALVKETKSSLLMVTHSALLAARLERAMTLRQGHLT